MNAVIIFGAKYLIYFLILLAGFCFFALEKNRRRELLLFAVIVLPLAYIVAKISSLLCYDPRPFVVGNFSPLVPHVADNGFPSDHTLLASAIAATVFVFKKRCGIFLFILAVIVGISRVLAGVHHVVDILGSIFISILVAYVVHRWIAPAFSKK